jgi:hypothetical protein
MFDISELKLIKVASVVNGSSKQLNLSAATGCESVERVIVAYKSAEAEVYYVGVYRLLRDDS